MTETFIHTLYMTFFTYRNKIAFFSFPAAAPVDPADVGDLVGPTPSRTGKTSPPKAVYLYPYLTGFCLVDVTTIPVARREQRQ